MRRSFLLLLVATLATAMLAAGAAGPAFAADRGGPVNFGNDGPVDFGDGGPVDFGDDSPVDFGENDGESGLFAQNAACEPPNRSMTTYEPNRYAWVDGPYFGMTSGSWYGCGREK